MATDEPAKKTNWLLWGGCGALLVVVLGCGGGIALCSGFIWNTMGQQDKRVLDEAGTPVTAVALSQAYLDNQSAADTQYQLKVLSVTGVVKAKKADNNIELAGAAGGQAIDCGASLSKLTLFNTVNVGDTVTVKGMCMGKPLGSIQVTSCQTVTKP